MFKIGNLEIKSPLFLAPMAGVTDHPFRLICKQYGAGVVYTEFVSANGIIRENLKTLEIDLNNTIKLSKLIPDSCDIICESGLNNNNDLKDMEKIGIMRFLVGESLMKSDNIELATKELLKR